MSPARARAVLYGLLLVVAGAAAVLSFAALRDLAAVCGFAPRLAWLLPVVIDAGAAAGSLVWLGEFAAGPARRFARALALALLALSVAANALGHGLAAFGLAPVWWVVVIVSAVAPAVLGAVVHLAVLVGRPDPAGQQARRGEAPDDGAHHDSAHDRAEPDDGGYNAAGALAVEGPGGNPVSTGPGVDWWAAAPAALPGAAPFRPVEATALADRAARVAELIAEGAGRRRLSRELGMTEHQARLLLARTREADEEAAGATGAGGAGEDVAGAASTRELRVNGSTIGGMA